MHRVDDDLNPIDSGYQVQLPNGTAVLVLGILSIPGCCCYGGLAGLILGIIALVLASKAQQQYYADPQQYTRASFKNLQTGRTTAIVGIVFAAVALLGAIVRIVMGESGLLSIDEVQEFIQEFLK